MTGSGRAETPRVLHALAAPLTRQPHRRHHAVAVHIKTRATLNKNVHPMPPSETGDLAAVRRGLPSTNLRYALKAAVNGPAGPRAMLPRELAASSATGVTPERQPNSHPPAVTAPAVITASTKAVYASARVLVEPRSRSSGCSRYNWVHGVVEGAGGDYEWAPSPNSIPTTATTTAAPSPTSQIGSQRPEHVAKPPHAHHSCVQGTTRDASRQVDRRPEDSHEVDLHSAGGEHRRRVLETGPRASRLSALLRFDH